MARRNKINHNVFRCHTETVFLYRANSQNDTIQFFVTTQSLHVNGNALVTNLQLTLFDLNGLRAYASNANARWLLN